MRALSDFSTQNTQTPPEEICLTSIKASETFQPACQSLRSSKRKRRVRKTITGRGIFSLESAKKPCVFAYADCKGEFMYPLITMFVHVQTSVNITKST